MGPVTMDAAPEITQGSLAETPVPALLLGVWRAGRSGALELKRHQRWRRLVFDRGAAVACTSNVADDSLPRHLVGAGVLTDAEATSLLAAAVTRGKRPEELLVEKGVLTAETLAQKLQSNLARALLDCFTWGDGTWQWLGDAAPPEGAARVNPAQLILTGVAGFTPDEVVQAAFPVPDTARFAIAPDAGAVLGELTLSAREAALLVNLEARPPLAELARAVKLPLADARRRLYGLSLLGAIVPADEAPPGPPPAPPPSIPRPAAPLHDGATQRMAPLPKRLHQSAIRRRRRIAAAAAVASIAALAAVTFVLSRPTPRRIARQVVQEHLVQHVADDVRAGRSLAAGPVSDIGRRHASSRPRTCSPARMPGFTAARVGRAGRAAGRGRPIGSARCYSSHDNSY